MASHLKPVQAASNAAKAGSQVPGIYRTKIGSTEVTSIFDGGMQMGPAIVLEPDEKEIKSLKEKAFIKQDYIPGFLNTFIVNTGKKLVLIDTGALGMLPTTGHLLDNLKAAGFEPSQVDEILLTHAHPDHAGGLLDKAGNRVFPKASLRIAAEELAFWFDDTKKAALPDKASAFDSARHNLTPYKESGQIETFKPGQDLGSGIEAVDLRGHTPGHSGFRIANGRDQLLIWGDIVHMQALQFVHPEWALTYDVDPAQAVASRKKILDEVATDRIRIGGMHLSFPGLGHVEKASQGYALVPQMWESEI